MSQMPGSNDAGIEQNPGVMEYWSIGVLEKRSNLKRYVACFFHHSIAPSLHYSGHEILVERTGCKSMAIVSVRCGLIKVDA
jgi:hypothetical protein